MGLLSASELKNELTRLSAWSSGEAAIRRTYKLADFRQATAFIVLISYEAEAANHHPTLTNTYNSVTVELSSHDVGGVTERDIDLAAKIDAIFQKHFL